MKLTTLRSMGIALVAAAMVTGLGGCKKNDGPPINTDPVSVNTGSSTGGEVTTSTGLPEIDASTLFDRARGLEVIYFDYNSYSLRPDAMASLKSNADKIRQVPGVIIQIEGHCDERGTQEYNLALGEKRALATREYLMNMGVSGDRMVTISYGEEDPADGGHTEAAWSKNRRSEFNKAL